MTAIISESYLSRPFTLGRQMGQSGRELIYDLYGTDDETEIEDKLVATAPPVYLGRVLDSVHAEPLGGGIWKGHAQYIGIENDSEYTFDTGGGTTKITQSLLTVNAYAPPGLTAPDFKGAIGVSEDKVEGVDIVTPNYVYSETHRFQDAFIVGGYKSVLFNMTGRTNDAPFKGMAEGECLFLGAAGSKRGDEDWSITFRFAGSPNAFGQTIGDITGVDKKGWEYLWVRYADYVDSFAFALVKRPVAAYVERVYLPGSFANLVIGI